MSIEDREWYREDFKRKQSVKVIKNDGEIMYFVGHREIAKPLLLIEPVGEVVAFSDSGLGGKRHLFTKHQISRVRNMQVSAKPDWV